MFDPADFWDPRWKQWIAEGDARLERKRIIDEQHRVELHGRESRSDSQRPAGVKIAVGVVELPIVLAGKRIGAPAATPGVCTCVDCLRLPIDHKSEKSNMLSDTENAVCIATGVSPEAFAAAKAKRSAVASPVVPQARLRAGFVVANSASDDPTDHRLDVTAGKKCLALFDAATSDDSRVEHLANAGMAFTAASRKLAHGLRRKDVVAVRFAK